MRIIVGLGNPGDKYKNTRHNIGFRVIDKLAAYFSIRLKEEEKLYRFGKGKISGEDVILAVPLTYMNRSGEAVRELLHYYKLSPNDLILIYDDIDLEPGQIKIKEEGGSGGHRGCSSVISCIGSQDFLRIRIGIGRPQMKYNVIDYVLSGFSQSEIPIIEDAIENASEAVRMIVDNNTTGAMNKYN